MPPRKARRGFANPSVACRHGGSIVGSPPLRNVAISPSAHCRDHERYARHGARASHRVEATQTTPNTAIPMVAMPATSCLLQSTPAAPVRDVHDCRTLRRSAEEQHSGKDHASCLFNQVTDSHHCGADCHPDLFAIRVHGGGVCYSDRHAGNPGLRDGNFRLCAGIPSGITVQTRFHRVDRRLDNGDGGIGVAGGRAGERAAAGSHRLMNCFRMVAQ